MSPGGRPGWGNLGRAPRELSVSASQGGHHDGHQSRDQSPGVRGDTPDLREIWVREFKWTMEGCLNNIRGYQSVSPERSTVIILVRC